MTGYVFSIRLNSDNPDEARIIQAIEAARQEHGRAGVRKISVEAFTALMNQRDDTRRMLDRQDEILRAIDQLRAAGIAIQGDGGQSGGVGGLDEELTANLLAGYQPGRKRK